MHVDAKADFVQKKGCTSAEYEDAVFPLRARRFSLDAPRRFALADGATEASFSRLWARLLVTRFARRQLHLPLELQHLTPAQNWWAKSVNARALSWYAEQKAESGAFASLLGLELRRDESKEGNYVWQASAVGDSCFFQIRDNKVAFAFPLEKSEDFTNQPDLLSSLPELNGHEGNLVISAEGTLLSGDQLFLMTDALACWFLKECERGNRPWIALSNLNDVEVQTTFEDFVEELRVNCEIKNDDVTLLRLQVSE